MALAGTGWDRQQTLELIHGLIRRRKFRAVIVRKEAEHSQLQLELPGLDQP